MQAQKKRKQIKSQRTRVLISPILSHQPFISIVLKLIISPTSQLCIQAYQFMYVRK